MRYYASWLCRFISVAPLQHEYLNLTPYCYVGNMPIVAIDYDGMYIIWAEDVNRLEKKVIRKEIRHWKRKSKLFRKIWRNLRKSEYAYTITTEGNLSGNLAEFDPKTSTKLEWWDQENEEFNVDYSYEKSGGEIYFDFNTFTSDADGTEGDFIYSTEGYKTVKDFKNIFTTPVLEEIVHAAQYDFYVKKYNSNFFGDMPGQANYESEGKTIVGMVKGQAKYPISDANIGEDYINRYGRDLLTGVANIVDFEDVKQKWFKYDDVQKVYKNANWTEHKPELLYEILKNEY